MTDVNNGLRILIVEDNPGDQYLITELLSASVIKIQLLKTAGTIAKAIDCLQEEIFDIILLDLSLPDSSGIGTFKAIKEPAGKIPVIILSGLADMNIAAEAISLGAQDYHIKDDLDERMLTKTILYIIERKRNLENYKESNDRYITISKSEMDLMQNTAITRQIMNSALDAIICADMYGKIIVWNPQAEKIFGWKEQEILGRTLADTIVPPEFREKLGKGIKHYLETGEGPILNKLIEMTAVDHKGQNFPVELTVIPLIENAEQFFCGFIQDISERRRAHEKENKNAERQKILSGLISAVGRVKKPEEIYDLTLDALLETTGAEKASILLFDENKNMQFVASRNLSDTYKKAVVGHDPWKPDEKDPQPIFIADVSGEPGLQDLLPDIIAEGITALCFVPLIHQQELLGKFMVYFNSVHLFTDEEMQLIGSIAGNVAFTIWEKKSAIALKESEEKYRSVFENSTDGIFLTSTDGAIYAANPSACKMFDMTEEEICRAGRSGIIDKDDHRLASLLYERLETGKATGELNLIRKGGSKFSAEISSSVFTDATGYEKTCLIVRDITERKENEEALVKSELYLRGTLDSTNDGILAIDNKGKVITTNNRFAELWHIPQELIRRKDDHKLLEYVQEQLVDPEAFLSKVQELYNSDRDDFDILYFRDKKVFERYSTPLVLNKNIVGRVWSFRDITKRRQIEEALRQSNERNDIVNKATSDIVWDWDLVSGKVFRSKEGLYKVYGYDNNEPIELVTNWNLQVHPDDRVMIAQMIEKILGPSDQTTFSAEYRFLRQDGSYANVFDRGYIIRDEHGKPVRMIGAAQNITERKRTEDQVKKQKEQYDDLVKNIPVGVYKFRMKPDGKMSFDYVSPRLCELIAVKEEDVYRDIMSAFNVVHKDDFSRFLKLIEESFFTKQYFSWEGRGIINDQVIWVRIESSPKLLEDGDMLWDGVIWDITESKKTEEKIIKSEEQYRDLVDHITDLICTHDLSGRVLSANKASEKLIGYKFDPLMNLNIKDILTADTKDKFNQYIDELKIKGHVHGLMKVQTITGEIRIWEYNNSLKTTGVETPIVRGYARDITERKKAENALRESEETFRRLFNESADAILLLGDTGFTECNQSAASILGYSSPRDVLIKQPWEISPKRQPDGRLSTEKAGAMIAKALQQGYNQFEWVHTKLDGTEFTVEVMLTAIILRGKQSFYTVWRDLTERRKIEQEILDYKHALDTSSILVITDPKGIIRQINENFCKISHYSAEELIGHDHRIVNSGYHPKSYFKNLWTTIVKGKIWTGEIRNKGKDGTFYWVSATIVPFLDDKGNPYQYVAIQKDITEQKKNGQALINSEERYKALVENAPEALVVFDVRDRKFVSVSASAEKLFKMSREELLKIGPVELSPEYQPGGQLSATMAMEKINETIAGGKPSFEWTHCDKEGNLVPCEVWLVSLPSETRTLIRGSIIDISIRKKAELAIIESEARYRSVIEQATDFVMITDMEGNFIDANSNFFVSFGYKKEEIPALNINHVIDPDQLKTTPIKFDLLVKGETVLSERRMLTKNGTIIEVEANVKRLPDGRILAIARDIRERKKAEEKFKGLLESAPDAMIIVDEKGCIVLANHQTELLFGYNKDDLIGQPVELLVPQAREKHQQLRDGYIRKPKVRVMAAGLELHAIRKDGSLFPVEISLSPLETGEGLLVSAAIRDITDRKKAEEEILKTNARFQMLSKATSDIIWDWDMRDDSLWWNDNYYSLLGIKKLKEITDIDHWYKRVHPDDLDRLKKDIEKAKHNHVSVRSHEYRYAKADGTYLRFLDRSFILRDQDGHPYRMIGSMVDMTPIYAAQKVIAESENRLRTIFETEPECIKLLGSKGELLDMNPAGLAMIEADNLEMVKGCQVEEIVAPAYRKAFHKLTRDVFKGKSGTLEFEIIGRKGTHRWLDTHAVPMRDAAGTIIALLGVTRNITERKLAEERVKKSEEKYRTIIEQAPDGIFISDRNTCFVDVNQSGCSMMGYTKEELLKMKFTELISPDNFKNNPVRMDELNSGKIVLSERELIRKDGSVISVEINAKLRSDGRYQSFIRDITSRKKAEQAVKESEEKYRTLVEQAVDAIALYDASGRILDVNSGAVNLLGYSKKELIKMNLSDALTKEEIQTKPVQYEVLQKGESTIKQRMMRKKDGSVVQTEVRSQRLPDGRFLSVIRDLTERVKAQDLILKEKQLSNEIIDSIPGVFFLRTKNKFLRWNKQFEKITGYTPEEIAGLEPVISFYDESDRERVYDSLNKLFTEGSAILEASPRTNGGEKTPFYFNARIINYEGEQCMICTGIDITDRKKAEQELEESYKAIRKLTEHLNNIREEERAHMAREIHDELGQQLTILKMDISWINKKIGIKDEAVNARMKELLVMLDETVQSVRRISSELRPSLLDDLGLTAAMEWQLTEFEKRFDIKTQFKPGDAEIKLPESMKIGLFRIFQESLTNVARHSKAKKVTVTLHMENGSVVLSVVDNGLGFDKQNAIGKKTLGILGMQERTSMMGGTYQISGKPGKGTRVVATIPLVDGNKN